MRSFSSLSSSSFFFIWSESFFLARLPIVCMASSPVSPVTLPVLAKGAPGVSSAPTSSSLTISSSTAGTVSSLASASATAATSCLSFFFSWNSYCLRCLRFSCDCFSSSCLPLATTLLASSAFMTLARALAAFCSRLSYSSCLFNSILSSLSSSSASCYCLLRARMASLRSLSSFNSASIAASSLLFASRISYSCLRLMLSSSCSTVKPCFSASFLSCCCFFFSLFFSRSFSALSSSASNWAKKSSALFAVSSY